MYKRRILVIDDEKDIVKAVTFRLWLCFKRGWIYL